jgi:hypothetical protein
VIGLQRTSAALCLPQNNSDLKCAIASHRVTRSVFSPVKNSQITKRGLLTQACQEPIITDVGTQSPNLEREANALFPIYDRRTFRTLLKVYWNMAFPEVPRKLTQL